MAEEGEIQTTTEKPEVIINDNAKNETQTETVSQKEEEEEEEMKPWEQHGGVISIPRFDYNAPSSLLTHSHSGFLITCTIKREKSATKEAMSILGKYLGQFTSCDIGSLDESDENSTSKRRKTCLEDLGGEQVTDNRTVDVVDDSDDKSDNSLCSATMETTKERNSAVSLVKLTRSGLLLFTFSRETSFDTVRVVSDVIQSLKSEGSTSPQWCHRIFPIQATCNLNEKELNTIVSKLVLEFVNDKRNVIAHPLKFAVGYNRRGFEETKMKIPKGTSNGSNSSSLLDRNGCFSIVAAAVKGVVPDSIVDLKSPEISVLVELLPLSRVPNGSFVVAVSVLPRSLVNTKPRLCVTALASRVKARD